MTSSSIAATTILVAIHGTAQLPKTLVKLLVFAPPKRALFWITSFLILSIQAERALSFVVTDTLETLSLSSVGTTFQSVSFENNYTNPVIVCNGEAPSNSFWLPIVRVTGLGSSGVQIRVQKFADDPDNYDNNPTSEPNIPVYIGEVHCLISESGAHQLPDGTWYHAGTTSVGAKATGASFNANINPIVRVNGLTSNMTGALAVVAQVITQNDARPHVAHVRGAAGSGCGNRQLDPFAGGFRTAFCIGRHTGAYRQARLAETLGWIVFPVGSGELTSTIGKRVAYARGKTSDTVRSVDNANAPYAFNSTFSLDMAVTTQQAEDGGDGSYSGLFGPSPLSGTSIRMALDESANRDRNHTTEPVAWWGFTEFDTSFDIRKEVDITETSSFDLLTYKIEIENTGEIDFNEINLTDELTQSTNTLPLASGPTLLPASDADSDGILDDNETWEYSATYQLTDDNFDAAADIINTAQTTVAINAGDPTLGAQTATSTTELTPNPKLTVIKSVAPSAGSTAPTGGASVGDQLTYTYTIENTGNVGLSPVAINDNHTGTGPLNFGNCAPVTDADADSVMGSVPFQIERLGAADTAACTVTYTVTQQDIDAQ